MNAGIWDVLFGLAAGACLNGWIVWFFYRRLPQQTLLGSIALYYLAQVLWLFAYLVVDGSPYVPEAGSDLRMAPYRIAFGLTILPAVALFVGVCTHSRSRSKFGLLQRVTNRRVPAFGIILCIFASGTPLYYLTLIKMDIPYLNAITGYLHISFFMTPVLIGLCWRQYPRAVAVFMFCMCLGGILAFGEGSRSLIFLPVGFFATGVWLTLRGTMRFSLAVAGLVLAIPTLYASAAMEAVRRDFRSGADASVIGIAVEMGQQMLRTAGTARLTEELARGISRMIVWSSISVLCDSPERVPYRGVADLGAEIEFNTRSTLSRNAFQTLEDAVDENYGMGAPKLYGFSISAGGTVPFPVLADGWSRAGAVGTALFAGFLCLALAFLERLIRRLFHGRPEIVLALLTILASSSFEKMSVYGFIYNVRYLGMLTFLWMGLALFFVKLVSSQRVTWREPRLMTFPQEESREPIGVPKDRLV